MDARTSRYHEVYARWLRDPEGFWGEAAQAIDWIEPARRGVRSRHGRLRPLVRRWRLQHLLERGRPPCDAGRGAAAGDHLRFAARREKKLIITYDRLLTEMQVLAGILRDFGVGKGDRVILYMPMVPEAVIAMLACARIGAIHSVVFGGFAAQGACDPHRRLQAEGDPVRELRLEPGRVVKYKPLLDEAIELSPHKPEACLILQRPQAEATLIAGRDHDWAAVRDHALVWAKSLGTACRSPPPTRSTSSTRPARPAGRRAWCATMAATWSR